MRPLALGLADFFTFEPYSCDQRAAMSGCLAYMNRRCLSDRKGIYFFDSALAAAGLAAAFSSAGTPRVTT